MIDPAARSSSPGGRLASAGLPGDPADRLVAQRLKELAADGLLERSVIPSTPVQIRYAPTADGRELMAVLQPLVSGSHRRRSAGPA